MRAHKIKSRLAALLCLLCLLCCLAGCGSQFDAAGLVQGNIDLVYKGEYDAEYLETVGISEDDVSVIYEEALQAEAAYFAGFFDVDAELAGDDMMARIIELHRGIYARTKYQIGETARDGDTYTVDVTVWPVDVFRKFIDEDSEAFMQSWREKLATAEFIGKPEQEIEAAWTEALVTAIEQRVETLDYLEPQTVPVRVLPNAEGYYVIDEGDWQLIDDLMIAY